MPALKPSAQRIPDVDPKSAAGVALTDAVQRKLRQFLGSDYVDRSLAQVGAGFWGEEPSGWPLRHPRIVPGSAAAAAPAGCLPQPRLLLLPHMQVPPACCLPQYVVVMLAHKTDQGAVGDNLVEFLGEVDAKELASWWVQDLAAAQELGSGRLARGWCCGSSQCMQPWRACLACGCCMPQLPLCSPRSLPPRPQAV